MVKKVACALAVALGLGFGLAMACDASRAGELSAALWITLPTLGAAAIAAEYARRNGDLYRDASFDTDGASGWLSVRSGDFSRGFLVAALLFGATFALSQVALPGSRVGWLARLYLQLGSRFAFRQHVAPLIAGLFVFCWAEEMVWRGLIPALLAEYVGSRRAWAWAALLYAVHSVPTMWLLADPIAGPNPLLVLGTIACGFAWAWMARAYGRLWPSVFSHFLFGWTALIMFPLWSLPS